MMPILKRLEKLIANLINFDPDSKARLSALAGKSVSIRIKKIDQQIHFTINQDGIEFLSDADEFTADVIITGTPLSLIGLINSEQNSQGFPKDLEIKGDINLAQKIQNLMRDLDIDWEEIFSTYIGDTAARKVLRMWQQGGRLFSDNRRRFGENLSEYLRFESSLLPDDLLVDEFTRGVDELRHDVERLKQRIDRLTQRMQAN